MMTDAKFNAEMIQKQLLGWTIINPVLTADSDGYDQRFGFLVKKGKKSKVVWVDQDGESNGAGWLAIDD